MASILANIRRFALATALVVLTAFSASSHATNVRFVGGATYTCVGGAGVLTANRVENFSSFYSGTLYLELWAFSTPYTGAGLTFGYKLAQYSLGQLLGGYYFGNVSSGVVSCLPPPNGTWYPAMILTEYTGAPLNGGYVERDYVNMSPPIVIGAPPAGQLSMTSALTFASQTVGTASAPQSFNISNVGGQAVTVSSITLSGADFTGSTSGCTFIAAGSFCTASVSFVPSSMGSKVGSVTIVSNGVGSPQTVQLSGLAVSGSVPPPIGTAIEYYHAAFNHYFVTAIADEITKLDNGTFVGWARTGQTFKVYIANQSALAAVCRFFSTSFAPKSSHFYTPDANECSIVKASPNWQFEAVVFYMGKADVSGNCPSGTQPVYRMYNNGQSGAPNHRYTTSLSVRSQMLNQGWIPEGYGPIGVIMCAPL